MLFDRRDPKSVPAESLRGTVAKTDPRAKFGKEGLLKPFSG
jgi:hypothetical protein